MTRDVSYCIIKFGHFAKQVTNFVDASAAKKAVDFITKTIKFTNEIETPENYGLCFEEFLTELS